MDIQIFGSNELEENILRAALGKAKDILAAQFDDFNANWKINVILSDDHYLQTLNSQFRGFDKPTDVLSFNYDLETIEADEIFGEIAISKDKVILQAKERNIAETQELEFLFVHGLLHLLGYDHETETERNEMFQLTDKIIGETLPFYKTA